MGVMSTTQSVLPTCTIEVTPQPRTAPPQRLTPRAPETKRVVDGKTPKQAGEEWQLIESEEPVLHTAKKPEPEIPERIKVPDFAHLLPEPIRRFTTKGVYDTDEHQHLSFTQGGGHGGSHPHLAHEFVTALAEGQSPSANRASASPPRRRACVRDQS